MPGYENDSRTALIEALKVDGQQFRTSTNIFRKGSTIEALKDLGRLRGDLLVFAANPDANPVLEPPPDPPNLNGLSETDMYQAQYQYQKLLQKWIGLEEAHKHKVSPSTYWQIEDYLLPFKTAVDALPALKGKRFMALTKRYENKQQQGGLSRLFGGGNDE